MTGAPTTPPRLGDPGSALRVVVLGGGATCLLLAVMASALLYLAGTGSPAAWPVVSLLGAGQLVALLAAGSAGWVLLAMRRRAVPAAAVAPVARHLQLLQRALLVWCVLATAGWVLARPALAIATLLVAAVTAQIALVLALFRRRLTGSGTG